MGCSWYRQRRLTQLEIADVYQRRFDQAPSIQENIINQKDMVEVLKNQNDDQPQIGELFKDQITDQSPVIELTFPDAIQNEIIEQSQQIQLNNQIKQNNQIQNELESSDHQNTFMEQSFQQETMISEVQSNKLLKTIDPLEIEHQWIIRCFQINIDQQMIKKQKVFYLKQVKKFQISDVTSIIDEVLLSGSWNTKEKLEWLLLAFHKIVYEQSTDQKEDNVEVLEGYIQRTSYQNIVSFVGNYLTTLVLYPNLFQINCPREDEKCLEDFNNEIATIVYDQIFYFNESSSNNNANVLYAYLLYLNKLENDADVIVLLNLMLKREFNNCKSVTLVNHNPQLTSLKLLQKIADYPNLVEPLLLNSWGFVHWDLQKTGKEFQFETIIGRSLSFSTFPNQSTEWKYIMQAITKKNIENQYESFRNKIKIILDHIAELFKKLLLNKITKPKTLILLNHIIDVNLNREKSNVELHKSCSNPGSIHNLVQVLLRIFSQFMETSQKSQINSWQIDLNLVALVKQHCLLSNIYRQSSIINQSESLVISALQQIEEPQLMTIIYLYIMRALGLERISILDYCNLINIIEDKSKVHQNGEYEQLLLQRQGYEIQLKEQLNIRQTMRFLCFTCRVALNLIKDGKPQEEYGILPTMFIEHLRTYIIQFYNIYSLTDEFIDEITIMSELTCMILCNKDLVNNNNIMIGSIKIFYILTLLKDQRYGEQRKIYNMFSENELIKSNLISGLINVFVESERTEIHQRWYCRSDFNSIITHLLERPQNHIYINQLHQLESNQQGLALKFANQYLADITKYFNLSLEKLKNIQQIQQKVDNGVQDNQENLIKDFNYVSEILHQYYHNFAKMIENLQKGFLQDQVIEELVSHLNYVLQQLYDNQAIDNQLLQNIQSKFQPKILTGTAIEILIILGKNQTFLESIVRDDRSFSIRLFKRVKHILYWDNILPLYEILEFDKIIQKLARLSRIHSHYKCIEDEAPEEFLDAMLGKLMTDPVQLPNSQVILDRLTIQKHLLTNQSDPYDRTPLTEDKLIEQPKLKTRIINFVKHRMTQIQKEDWFELEYEINIDDLTNIPAQFLDAKYNRLMLDPVTLPSSGTNIDRTTMEELFEANPFIFDPFYLQEKYPLRKDMMVDNPELKEQINAYLRQERINAIQRKQKDQIEDDLE